MIYFVICSLFFKINFFKKLFQERCQRSNSLDPDQDLQNVGADLGPNCLQRLLAGDTKIVTSRQSLSYLSSNYQIYFTRYVIN